MVSTKPKIHFSTVMFQYSPHLYDVTNLTTQSFSYSYEQIRFVSQNPG